MMNPARKPHPADDGPPIDPTAIPRAYQIERARRRMRSEHKRARKRAHFRFYITMAVLLAVVGTFVFLIMQETQKLFGI